MGKVIKKVYVGVDDKASLLFDVDNVAQKSTINTVEVKGALTLNDLGFPEEQVLTYAQYQALSAEEKNSGKSFYVTDAPQLGVGTSVAASELKYDNTTSKMSATTTQNAVTELKGKIDGNLAPTENGSTSSAAYDVGKRIMRNGLLYRVKQSIAIGDVIVVGTNIERTNVDTELASAGSIAGIYVADVSGATATVSTTTASILWTDPNDVATGGVTLAKWSGTKVVRKEGSAPQDIDDGTVVVDNKVRNAYSSTAYQDTNLEYDTTYQPRHKTPGFSHGDIRCKR